MLAKICSRMEIIFENRKMFVWTRKMQFWEPCQQIFANRSKIFRSKSEKNWNTKKFSENCFSSKCSTGHVECTFDNPADVFFVSLKSWAFPDFFFKIDWGGKFAVECVSNDFVSSRCFSHLNCEFLQKISKFLNLEKLQNLTETLFCWKNTLSSF